MLKSVNQKLLNETILAMNISKTFFLVTLLLSVQSFSDGVGFFTFTPKGGAELLHPNGDPTTVIKIYFDSEIVYVTDEGEFDLTKENLLKMIEIKPHDKNKDLVTMSGPIDASKVSFSNAEGKTTITINPPDTIDYYVGYASLVRPGFLKKIATKNFGPRKDMEYYSHNFSEIEFYEVNVKSFALKDAENTINEDSLDITYPDFFAGQFANSCHAILDTELGYTMGPQIESDERLPFELSKADPNTTYNIDIAFIVSKNNLNIRDIEGWRQFLDKGVLPIVNKIYQNSGVNVQFNVKAVRAFSEYKNYLDCPVDLDGFSYIAGHYVISELVPRIQNDTGADLIYALYDYYSVGSLGLLGASTIRTKNSTPHFSSRWHSFGSLNVAKIGNKNTLGSIVKLNEPHFADSSEYWIGTLEEREEVFKEWSKSLETAKQERFANILAHELGHNLGLTHMTLDKQRKFNLYINGRGKGDYYNSLYYKDEPFKNFTGYGYGYNSDSNGVPYEGYGTTIMLPIISNVVNLPLFSTNGFRLMSDVCNYINEVFKYQERGLYEWSRDFCNNISNDNDVLIRLGDSTANSRDALQYTIEDASNYSELYRVNKRQ